MEKYLKYFVLMLAAALSLSLTACGGGDDDEPENPDKPSAGKYEVVTRTIDVGSPVFVSGIHADGGYEFRFCVIHTNYGANANNVYFTISRYSSDYAINLRKAVYGTTSSLKDIKIIKGLDWQSYDSPSKFEEKCGYVLEGTYGGRSYYFRLFIDSFNTNASGDIIGINLQYQQFVPAQ